MTAPLFVGLIHYPCYKKDGRVITTSLTPMDVHDIARTGMTYGVQAYYVINPLPTMMYLANRITDFWNSDFGMNYNRTRTDALSIVKVHAFIEESLADIEASTGHKPVLAATSAKPFERAVSYEHLRERMASDPTPVFLLFGTGYGMIQEFVNRCDLVLEPIVGPGTYNHLSVRSAAAISLDRLCRP